jgi:serine protease Do
MNLLSVIVFLLFIFTQSFLFSGNCFGEEFENEINLNSNSVSRVAEIVAPWLVNITVTGRNPQNNVAAGRLWQPWNPRKSELESEGSGIVYTSSGYIVTNYHVIAGATSMELSFYNGVRYVGVVAGVDVRTDLALVKINDSFFNGSLPEIMVAEWGDSDKLKTGQFIVAAGSPYSLRQTVTFGIISALGRSIPSGESKLYNNLIQIDASINPGNSGGPLASLEGKIIGVNSALRITGQGLGFAIPSNLARKIAQDILLTGKPRRSSLGLSYEPVTLELSRKLGMARTYGVVVTDITDGGPAAKAGIKKSDIILKIDGFDILTSSILVGQVQEAAIGDSVDLLVRRDAKSRSLKIIVAESR